MSSISLILNRTGVENDSPVADQGADVEHVRQRSKGCSYEWEKGGSEPPVPESLSTLFVTSTFLRHTRVLDGRPLLPSRPWAHMLVDSHLRR